MNVIDLTHPIENGMIKFDAPWHIKTSICQVGTIETNGRNTSAVTIGTHAGTHMDASLHFIKNGESIDKISLDKLIGNARIVNFTNLPENYCVTAKDLSQIPLCERTLFCFDWAKHWNTGQFYKQYPFFDETAAIYLISHGVKVLGMDTPSPDDSAAVLGGERDSVIHKLFLSNGVTLIEYLNNLDFALKDKTDWLLCALPLPFKGLDGSPSRVCLIDKGELYDN